MTELYGSYFNELIKGKKFVNSILKKMLIMSEIDDTFVKLISKVWHRYTPSNNDASTLAGMLKPMDIAGEEVAENIEFDDEPSDFNTALEELAEKAGGV